MRLRFRFPALAILATLVTIGASLLAAQPQQSDEKVQRNFNVNNGSTLQVENYKGTIHVTGSDTNQVAINAVKRFSGSDSDRKWWMENTKIDFSGSGDRVEVHVHYPNQNSCWVCGVEHDDYVAQVELEIQVPRRTNLDLNGYKPDINIASTQGSIRIKSYKSPMTIVSTNGSVFIDTYKDNIHLKNAAVHGGLEVKSYKADAELELRALDGTARLENQKGSILLRVPGDLGFNLDFSGERRASFHSDFPINVETRGRYGSSVVGAINKGGTPLIIRTGKGSVSLEKLAGDL